MDEKTKVAVIGARGIGKHHAKWHHLSGAEVVAFVGTSEETCRATAKELRALFDFRGRAYWDVAAMLEQERPDVVDVCSPPDLHKTHTLMALEAGAHVLCEKPLVWDEAMSSAQMRTEVCAEELAQMQVQLAEAQSAKREGDKSIC